MRNILIPTDFSENAMHALYYAIALFKYEPANIYLLNTSWKEVDDLNGIGKYDFLELLKPNILNVAKAKLEETKEYLAMNFENPLHTFFTIAVFGPLADEVHTLVEKEDIDVIIMGAKGKTNDKNILFGKNTIELRRRINCALLTIPEAYSDFMNGSLATGTDKK